MAEDYKAPQEIQTNTGTTDALKEKITDAILFSKLSGVDTSQFSNKNITAMRKEDIEIEKITAKAEYLEYQKEATKQVLYDTVKAEYGSVPQYAKEKLKDGFTKSERHMELSSRLEKFREQSDKQWDMVAGLKDRKSDKADFKFGKKRYSSTLPETSLERKAAKAAQKLETAERKVKTRYVKRKTFHFDRTTNKIVHEKTKVEEVVPIDGYGGIVTKSLKGAAMTAGVAINPWTRIKGELGKYESDNAALKVTMKGVRTAESGARAGYRLAKNEKYRKVARLQKRADKANAKLYAQRKGNTIWSRHQLKKQYMKKAEAARKATTKGAGKTLLNIIKGVGKVVGGLLKSKVALIVIGVALLLILLFSLISMLLTAITGSGAIEKLLAAMVSTYSATDENIYRAYDEYLEAYHTGLSAAVASLSSCDEILVPSPETPLMFLDPHDIVSFLSAYWIVEVNGTGTDPVEMQPFNFDRTIWETFIGSDPRASRMIVEYFNTFYTFSTFVTVEIRQRQETRSYWNGISWSSYTVTIDYEYKIGVVLFTAINQTNKHEVIAEKWGQDVLDIYRLMFASKGNREPGLFWTEADWNTYATANGII